MSKIGLGFKMKCPQCTIGDIFESKNPFNTKMQTNCPNCGLKFEKEPGFFYGAMYISYMFNIAFFVAATIAYYLYFDERVDYRIYIAIYLGLILVLLGTFYKLSRSIWIQFFSKPNDYNKIEY